VNHIAIHSDPGPRDTMEDAALAFSLPRGTPEFDATHVLLVFDGVGGQCFGEVASAEGVRHLASSLFAMLAARSVGLNSDSLGAEHVVAAMCQALQMANQAICLRSSREPALKGMASTVVCGLVLGDTLVTGWAGDSKCYICTEAGLRQVTRDHSRVQALIDRGEIKCADAGSHPEAHVITRYLGQAAGFVPDIVVTALRPADLIVLCTDGLTDVVPDHNIAQAISECREGRIDLQHLASELVYQAIAAGTQDNTTVLCYRHGPDPLNRILNRTCTAAYATAAARALHSTSKETTHDDER